MSTIFVSGSRNIKELDSNVKSRIDNIIQKKFEIIIGDAIGVDRQVQCYLADNNVKSVTVYCSNGCPRINIGKWNVRDVLTGHTEGTREFYAAKDLQMAKDCDYGFMVWNGRSTGTLSNVIELLLRNKISVVYLNEHQHFLPVKKLKDLENLMGYMDERAIAVVEKKTNLTAKLNLLYHSFEGLL